MTPPKVYSCGIMMVFPNSFADNLSRERYCLVFEQSSISRLESLLTSMLIVATVEAILLLDPS